MDSSVSKRWYVKICISECGLIKLGIGVVLCAIWIYMGNAGQDIAFDPQNNFWSSILLLAWIGYAKKIYILLNNYQY